VKINGHGQKESGLEFVQYLSEMRNASCFISLFLVNN
jgi:hypothetical protein